MLQILHIEDQDAHSELARLALASLPIQSYDRVESVGEALACIRLIQHDLILIDLDLADSAGLETLEEIKAERPDSALIVLSNRDAEEFGVRAIRAGADDFVPKTELATDTLPRTVRHVFARRDRQINRRTDRA